MKQATRNCQHLDTVNLTQTSDKTIWKSTSILRNCQKHCNAGVWNWKYEMEWTNSDPSSFSGTVLHCLCIHVNVVEMTRNQSRTCSKIYRWKILPPNYPQLCTNNSRDAPSKCAVYLQVNQWCTTNMKTLKWLHSICPDDCERSQALSLASRIHFKMSVDACDVSHNGLPVWSLGRYHLVHVLNTKQRHRAM